jgi:hypothetical protein
MSISEMAVEPPLDLQMQMIDSAAALHFLAIRQSSWTVALNNAGSEPTADEGAAIAALGNEIDAQFADIGKHTDHIRAIFEQYGPWINEGVAAALASGKYPKEQVAALRRVTGTDDEDFASRGAALADSLWQSVPEIRSQFKDGIGGVPGGSVLLVNGASTGCGMMAAASMLGLALCPKTAGAGCAVGAAGLIGMVALGC